MSTMMRTVSNLNTRSLLSLTSQGGFRKHHSVRHQQKCVDKGHVGRCSRWIHSCQLAWGSLGFPPFQFDPDALLRSQDELSDRPQLLTCLTGFDVKVTQNVRQHHLLFHLRKPLTWGAIAVVDTRQLFWLWVDCAWRRIKPQKKPACSYLYSCGVQRRRGCMRTEAVPLNSRA